MTGKPRRIALVCMTPRPDANELGTMEMPSYGVRRVLASLADTPALAGGRLALIDLERPDVEGYVAAIERFEPDLIGFSIYVWSAPCMVEVARRVKRSRPGCTIVFGGPSARTAFFDLPPYAEPHTYLDAVVSSDGEITFREIAVLPELSRSALRAVGGLDLPDGPGWLRTGPRTPIRLLDELASPFQMGLMKTQTVAYLETFRGCPLSCRFCEWGATDTSQGVFSTDSIARELEAFKRHGVPAVFSVDAGLNLNAKAFRNLRDAEARVGLLESTPFWSEVYPSRLTEEHLEFLASVKAAYLGIGLQSTDPAVLRAQDRRFDDRRLESVVGQLSQLANTEVQIILGLPGDSPEGFRRTLAYARALPANVRAYHCLVLPDALLTRGRPEWDMRFDPVTLRMTSCRGWTAEALAEAHAELTRSALAAGGKAGDFWWFFPRAH